MDQPKTPLKAPIGLDMEPGTYFWCSCGESSKQPFCDGSHKGTSFAPIKEVLTEAKQVWWCACKQTGNRPLCDGSHKSL